MHQQLRLFTIVPSESGHPSKGIYHILGIFGHPVNQMQ